MDSNRLAALLQTVQEQNTRLHSMLVVRDGQHIHVFPAKDLVVIFTSATPVASDAKQFEILMNHILPSIRADEPLPEKPDSAAKLQALLQEAAQPIRPAGDLPPAAATLNGKPSVLARIPWAGRRW